MTKLENVTVEQAKAASAETMSSTETVLPVKPEAEAGEAKTEAPAAARKHGPTTTMMSGWAQGGSSAG